MADFPVLAEGLDQGRGRELLQSGLKRAKEDAGFMLVEEFEESIESLPNDIGGGDNFLTGEDLPRGEFENGVLREGKEILVELVFRAARNDEDVFFGGL